MCTAIVYRNSNKNFLGIGFNRDESYKRGPAIEPKHGRYGSIRFISPVDGDYGGTWIGVNSNHTVYAVLNFYEAELKIIRNPTSRGLLAKKLLGEEIDFYSLDLNLLKTYYPFRILKINMESTEILIWDGNNVSRFRESQIWRVYASSFLLGNQIENERWNILQEHFLSNELSKDFYVIAEGFLSSHFPEKGPHSPCMHRREAHTVSNTIISIENNVVQMKYKNAQPCEDLNYNIYEL